MRKITSSAFILILLLLSLWGLSTWFVATKNKATIEHFLTKTEGETFGLINVQRTDIKHSVFSTQVQYSLTNTSDNVFSAIWDAPDNQWIANIDIVNGPLLFDKSGLEFANSAWKIQFARTDNKFLQKLSLKQAPVAVLRHGFDNKIYYQLAIQLLTGNINISGIYDANSAKGSGEIQLHNFLFKDKSNAFKANQASIRYQHSTHASEEFQLDLNAEIPEFLYQHQRMTEHLSLQLSEKTKLSIRDQQLNLASTINVKQNSTSQYPIDKSQLTFKITNLDTAKVSDLYNQMSELENLTEQKQWLLEEQGELPEGQDQIWQRQDHIEQIRANFPLLVNQLLINHNKALATFSVSTEFNNSDSILIGSVLPLSVESSSPKKSSSSPSLFSLMQAQADVTLANSLLKFIATQLPISKNQFTLTYKNNSLLMQ